MCVCLCVCVFGCVFWTVFFFFFAGVGVEFVRDDQVGPSGWWCLLSVFFVCLVFAGDSQCVCLFFYCF